MKIMRVLWREMSIVVSHRHTTVRQRTKLYVRFVLNLYRMLWTLDE